MGLEKSGLVRQRWVWEETRIDPGVCVCVCVKERGSQTLPSLLSHLAWVTREVTYANTGHSTNIY